MVGVIIANDQDPAGCGTVGRDWSGHGGSVFGGPYVQEKMILQQSVGLGGEHPL